MGQNSKITWTDDTFNIAWGCSKVSPGCQNCYADGLASRYGHDVWGLNKPRRTFGEEHWNKPLAWNRDAEKSGERRRVFCASMCDVFENHPTIDQERGKLWPLIRATPFLDWQILTKRAERIADNLPADWKQGYPNVWLGVSVETNDYVWRFNEHLAKIPAVVRFVSYEPALGLVTDLDWKNLDWLIYGGESGNNFRSHDVNWARAAKAKCDEFGAAFFYKQGNGFKSGTNPNLDGKIIQEFPAPRVVSDELALAA
jgi:protein gp37